jgi:hypothetical protein
MRKFIWSLAALAVGFLTLALARPAMANQIPAIDGKQEPAATVDWAKCPNLDGWYVNEDETGDKPEPTADGLKFTGKDLIHRQVTPIDFTAFDNTNKSFAATGDPDKVAFKAETSAPYGNIVIQPDGKLWSTSVAVDSTGGQNHPVAHAADLFGDDVTMKPGKAKFSADSRVTTIGVGYWTEGGSTVVSSITFHGVTYPLTCKPEPSHSVSASPSPSASASGTHKPSASVPASPSRSRSAVPAGAIGGSGSTGDALAITGPSTVWIAVFAAGVLLVGGSLVYMTRRRNSRFIP